MVLAVQSRPLQLDAFGAHSLDQILFIALSGHATDCLEAELSLFLDFHAGSPTLYGAEHVGRVLDPRCEEQP
jgi:hypothetical protein